MGREGPRDVGSWHITLIAAWSLSERSGKLDRAKCGKCGGKGVDVRPNWKSSRECRTIVEGRPAWKK